MLLNCLVRVNEKLSHKIIPKTFPFPMMPQRLSYLVGSLSLCLRAEQPCVPA